MLHERLSKLESIRVGKNLVWDPKGPGLTLLTPKISKTDEFPFSTLKELTKNVNLYALVEVGF